MSGEIIELFPRCRYKFSNLTSGQTLEVPVVRALDVSEWADLTLLVRVHSVDIGTSGEKIEVIVKSVSPTCEDPAVDFADAAPLATITLDGTTVASTLEAASLGADFGSYLQVRVKGDATGGGNVDATLSADLVARSTARTTPVVRGDFTLDSASPRLTVGNGTGAPVAGLDKADSSAASVDFENEGTTRWKIVHEADEDLAIARYNSSGVLQDSSIISASNGLWTLPDDLTLDSAAAKATLGDGSGSPVVLFNKSGLGTATIDMQSAGVDKWKMLLDSGEDLVFGYGSGPTTSATAKLTDGSWEFASNLSLESASPDLTVGSGSGSPDIILNKSAGGSAKVVFQQGGSTKWDIVEDSGEDLLIRQNGSSTSMKFLTADGGIRGKLLATSYHNYSRSASKYVLVPWNSTAEYYDTSWSSADVGYYYTWGVAPYDGRLVKLFVRSDTAWSGSSSSAARLYVMTEGATTNTARGSWIYLGTHSANYTRVYDMGSSATVNAEEKIGIVIWTSSANHGLVQVCALWEFDQNS